MQQLFYTSKGRCQEKFVKMAKINRKDSLAGVEARVLRAFGCDSIGDAAEILQMNYHTVRNYLQLRRDAPTGFWIKIAKMTNCSLDWLLTGKGDKTFTAEAENRILDASLEARIRSVVRDELGDAKRPPATLFPLEQAVEKYRTLEATLAAWFKFEGKELPADFAVNFHGWEKLTTEDRLLTARQIKELIERLDPGSPAK